MGDRSNRGSCWALALLGGVCLVATACTATVDEPDARAVTEAPTSAVASPSVTGPKACDSEPRRAGPTVQDVLDDVVSGHHGGVVVAIGRDGDPVRICAAGRADTAGTPLEADDAFRIGSITKTFTAVIVLQLVDEGVIGLDDDVAELLPEAPLTDGVTVRHLLNHSSGIPDVVSLSGFVALLTEPPRAMTPEEGLGLLAGRERDFEPGADHEYSNSNYIVAGLIVERVTGLSLAENLRTRIIEPLGLDATALTPDGPEPVTGFSPDYGPDGHNEGVSLLAFLTMGEAAGGIVSTAGDLTVFFRALSAGELMSSAAMAEMTDFQGQGGAGLGLWRMRLPTGPGYGHGGQMPGYISIAAVRPESGDVFVQLTNEDGLVPHQFERAIFRAW